MGAILGFSGWSGKKSRAMADALSHRGVPPVRTYSSIRATICWLPSRSNYGGILEHRRQVIALAGRLVTDQEKTHMAPLLRSYREKGLGFIQDLRGAYVLAVQDEDSIHLARDPAGLRTIYYGLHKDRFIFAIEPKGILAWSGFARNLRPAAVAQYFSYGFVPGSNTMLENLWELPPGHTVTFAQGKLEPPRRVQFFEHEKKEEKDEQEWHRKFSALHQQALADQLPAHGSVGLFLSGGLCSGAIGVEGVEALKQRAERLPSWSISFKNGQQGADHASSVAKYIGTDHRHVWAEEKEFLKQVGKAVCAAGEPVGDPSMVLLYMLSAIASEDVEYLLNGAGGSLVFGGIDLLSVLLRYWYRGADQGCYCREQAYLSSCCAAYNDLNVLLTPEWRSLYTAHEALEGLLTPFFQSDQTESFLNQLAVANIELKGGHMQLPLLNRMTGAYGLTPLTPLFDDRLIALSLRMPAALRLCQGREKGLIREVYHSALPQHIIKTPQAGIRFPCHFWFRRECKKYARRILRKRAIKRAGIFNSEQVEALLAFNPEQAIPQHERTLWLLITFELWRREVLEAQV
ncbi:MAG: hypothetical protein D3916_01185 [Candidatus Electrothrix sp. MAN1_4]|nr:hypothetical protein [Candidatus Electrothrix sp. MAN1_4]